MVCVKPEIQKILIVEDHPLTSEGFVLILKDLSKLDENYKYKIEIANSLKDAYHYLMEDELSFDIVLLDIRMNAFPELKLFSGEDLGKLINNHCPETKIIILTSILDKYRLHGILKSLNPMGFLIKTEVNQKTLRSALEKVSEGNYYYSNSILKLINSQYFSNTDLDMEEIEFLYLLSKGTPTKDIPNHLPWSLSKAEKKKRTLREKLNIEEKNVHALIHRARELGII